MILKDVNIDIIMASISSIFFLRFLIINLCCILHLRTIRNLGGAAKPQASSPELEFERRWTSQTSVYFGYEKTHIPQSFWDVIIVIIYFEIISVFLVVWFRKSSNISPWRQQACHAYCHGTEKIQRALGCIDELLLASLGKVCSHHHLRSRHYLKVAGNPVDGFRNGETVSNTWKGHGVLQKKKVGIPKCQPARKTDLNEINCISLELVWNGRVMTIGWEIVMVRY